MRFQEILGINYEQTIMSHGKQRNYSDKHGKHATYHGQ